MTPYSLVLIVFINKFLWNDFSVKNHYSFTLSRTFRVLIIWWIERICWFWFKTPSRKWKNHKTPLTLHNRTDQKKTIFSRFCPPCVFFCCFFLFCCSKGIRAEAHARAYFPWPLFLSFFSRVPLLFFFFSCFFVSLSLSLLFSFFFVCAEQRRLFAGFFGVQCTTCKLLCPVVSWGRYMALSATREKYTEVILTSNEPHTRDLLEDKIFYDFLIASQEFYWLEFIINIVYIY